MALEDFEIVDLYFKRDEKAISETEAKYGYYGMAIAGKLLDDGRDVEECLSDSYIALWNSIPPTRPNSLKAYFSKLVRNLSIKKFEYNKAAKRNSDLEVSLNELENVLADKEIKPEFSEEDIAHLISKFLRTQKLEARNIFIRKYYYFESLDEICERYEISESKVKSVLFQMRKRLRKYLEKEGVKL